MLYVIRVAKDIINDLKVELFQVPRSQNSLADKLAKWGAMHQVEFMGDFLPDTEEFVSV